MRPFESFVFNLFASVASCGPLGSPFKYKNYNRRTLLTATSNLGPSRDKDPWGHVSSVPTPVSVHYELLQTLDMKLITNLDVLNLL